MAYLRNQSNREECVTILGLILALSPGCNKNTMIFDISIQKLSTNEGYVIIINQYSSSYSLTYVKLNALPPSPLKTDPYG